MLMSEQDKLNDYDSEPVKYCARCYSLKIQYEETVDLEYCKDCGCSEIVESTIDEWEKKYERRYGHKFAEKSNDLRKSPIFKLSIAKLKAKVFESPKWETIVRELYSCIPRGIGKADQILWLFDRLIKDNRLDDLRLLLVKLLRKKDNV